MKYATIRVYVIGAIPLPYFLSEPRRDSLIRAGKQNKEYNFYPVTDNLNIANKILKQQTKFRQNGLDFQVCLRGIERIQ